MDLAQLTLAVCEVAREAGAFIDSQAGQVVTGAIEEKFLNNLVSFVDIEAEKMIVNGLKDLIPYADFLAEEETVNRNLESPYLWIIDPLDGTTNFLHQVPAYAVSIGLKKEDEIVLGVVYEITRKECFYAWKGGGAFLNGERIQVSTQGDLSATLIATGFPFHNYSSLDNYLKVLRTFMLKTRGIRRMGSAAVDLCFVACGRFEAYFEENLNPWDIVAGALIVQEAGGVMSDFDGGDTHWEGKAILAANHAIYKEVLAITSILAKQKV